MSTTLRKGISIILAGTVAMSSIIGATAAIGPIEKNQNIPYNVLQSEFRSAMSIAGIGAVELGSSGSCGENATYTLDMDGTLTISGTGEIYAYNFMNNNNIKKVIINEGITSVGYCVFSNSVNIESIQLPESLETIGELAFQKCSMTSIEFQGNIKSIGIKAFLGCTKLETIVIPDNITQVDEYAFAGCTALKSVKIGKGLKQISKNMFSGCKGLENVTIPSNIESIGEFAFNTCQNLKSVTLEEGIQTIAKQAFSFCEGLTSITIPSSVATIGVEAFSRCNSLTEINGGEGIESIGTKAFRVQQPYSEQNKLETNLNTSNEYFQNYDWAGDNREIVNKVVNDPSCGDDATYKKEDGKVIITGSGSIDDEAFKDDSTITEVVIEEGITEIGNSSFENMENLESVKIPDSVTNIGDNAFAEDPNLGLVEGGENANIQDNAFTSTTPGTTIKTDNKNIYDNIVNNTDRDVQLANTVPVDPADESWEYVDEKESFATDRVQKPSVGDDINSLTDEYAPVEGLDDKQGVKSEYEVADENAEDTLVAVTKASDFIVAIPKVLVMEGNGEESTAEYKISVFGHVDPAKRVTVTPEASFELVNQGKSNVVYTAQISQPDTGINGMDILEDPTDEGTKYMTGTITANIKKAGSYKGTVMFTIDYVDHI